MAKATTNACDPASHHAIADGKTVITQQLQQTIDACSQQGGGIVSLHKGLWLSGPLSLKEGVTLNLEQGSTLQADNREKQFKHAFIEMKAQTGEAFILANHVNHVGITGNGTLNGSGKKLWRLEALKVHQIINFPATKEHLFTHSPGTLTNNIPKPWLIEFNAVKHGQIGAILATKSPMKTIVLRNSQYISLDGTRISNPENIPNSDGIHIIASQHITMKHLDISTKDNDIAIQSGRANEPSRPHASSDINILDSVIHQGQGISISSNTANGIGKIYIHRVRFANTLNGFRVHSTRGYGAPIGPITINNIKMIDVKTPLLLTESDAEPASIAVPALSTIKAVLKPKTAPIIHDVSIINLVAVNANVAGVFNGLPESPLQNIQLKYIDIRSKRGIKTSYAHISAAHVHISTEQGQPFNLGPGTELTAN
ncbi:glycoside hydrolase family 28 protein [Celerinatantimonas diazotrophica]|uniref:glycoside hydrolase family 28 protein n=1 Tax=Celerinatantimonas diazotrophica TaxID=412034 RepID=UPI001404CCBA|nr:glycosyl hydrolase family 28 protein [Celerinatantimonas diazotrophica]